MSKIVIFAALIIILILAIVFHVWTIRVKKKRKDRQSLTKSYRKNKINPSDNDRRT